MTAEEAHDAMAVLGGPGVEEMVGDG